MTKLTLYYSLKPLIPRRVQILLRRLIAIKKRRAARNTWPIDRSAGKAPAGWTGWPEQKKFAFILNHDVDTAKGHGQSELLSSLEQDLGFRSAFYFVPEGYPVSRELILGLQKSGFEIGVHGLRHDGKMFSSKKVFLKRAARVNSYIREWGASGFSSPSMCRNLDWMSELDIQYGVSTFDTDPFEPQPEGVRRIFPFWHQAGSAGRGYVEVPYTLPQDHALFIILREKDNRIWKEKLDWIVEHGGMALLNTHPDYMRFNGGRCSLEKYPVDLYVDFLKYVKNRYAGLYWNVHAKDLARFWSEKKL